MKIFGFDVSWRGFKASTVAPLVAMMVMGQTRGVWTKRNFAQYADDAYKRNVIAYRAIGIIARSAAFIPLKVFDGEKEVAETHPLVRLLKRPNPWMGGAEFMEAVIAHLHITGNTYIEGVGPEGAPPLELWPLRPDRTRVVPGPMGVIGYVYEVNGQIKQWKCDPIDGKSPILHVKFFNPLDDWYGMSPVEAAAYAVDGHNMAGEWNQGLLQNSARPSGAMVYNNASGGTLSDEQFNRIKEELNAAYAGTRNAGRPMILEGGLDWKQISLTPAEMDWINGKNNSAREIALAFAVPPQILGIPGDNTYSNYQEARQALYEDTVVPVLDRILDALNVWLCPLYGPNICIRLDVENLPAMANKRAARWTAVQNATWLTINEKREATGLEPITGKAGNTIFVASGLVPVDSMILPDDEEMPGELEGEAQDEEGADDSTPTRPDVTEKPGDTLVGDGVDPQAGADVQTTALNGAQITSLLAVVQEIVSGGLTAEAAGNILRVAFPSVPANLITAIVDSVAKIPKKPKPEVEDGAPPAVPPKPPKE